MQLPSEDQQYPDYVEQFSVLYSQLEQAPHYSNNAILKKVTWDFGLFAHAITNKAYSLGLELLKRIGQSLSALLCEIETQSPHYDIAFTLYKFTIGLQKQFEAFMQKKKQIKTK